ncbi:pURF24 [African swine fever virus]|uniref:PURF24 n=1 Tax=African swine fever virus TaxID=10497 RepID=A0A2Z5DGJ2_ASF|nr:pURF24 [African swine fever virus]AXB49473.1 pURF24 [African swine fever virus]AXB49645.1 pURF24 [African swine fever virus]AXB49816.1 pURF24 [African swine fever virus]AXB49989.1 pURF24 [African swine fever virus]
MYCLIRKWIYYVLIVCLHITPTDNKFLTIFGTVTLVPTKTRDFFILYYFWKYEFDQSLLNLMRLSRQKTLTAVLDTTFKKIILIFTTKGVFRMDYKNKPGAPIDIDPQFIDLDSILMELDH